MSISTKIIRILLPGFTAYARLAVLARRGFGLHWRSGALNQFGGRLSAQSPGSGRDATFTSLLPVNPLLKARP